MDKAIKKKVNKFISENSLKKINYRNLRAAAENIGYTVIEFNSVLNDHDVAELIKDLKLNDVILHSRGFTYADKNFRLIFIHEDLNEKEKVFVLSHELGHIVCEHFGTTPIIGNDVKEEHEASGFSHYLLNDCFWRKLQLFFITGDKQTIVSVGLVLVICALLGFSVVTHFNSKPRSNTKNEFYATSSGNKYHKKDCQYVENKNNVIALTKKDLESGKYDACSVCLPEG